MRRFAILVTLLPAVALAGCGRSGPVRHEITGTITLKNQPIEQGVINFEPMDGQGSKDGATIENGSYTIPKDKGLFPGRYKVSIYAGDGITGAGDASPDIPKAVRNLKRGIERVPAQYNTKSTLIFEVKPDQTTFDFDVP